MLFIIAATGMVVGWINGGAVLALWMIVAIIFGWLLGEEAGLMMYRRYGKITIRDGKIRCEKENDK